MPKDHFDVDYFYCDAAPYVDSDYKVLETDPARMEYMREKGRGVRLIKFKVGAKDITTPLHTWLDTDFWQFFGGRKL